MAIFQIRNDNNWLKCKAKFFQKSSLVHSELYKEKNPTDIHYRELPKGDLTPI